MGDSRAAILEPVAHANECGILFDLFDLFDFFVLFDFFDLFAIFHFPLIQVPCSRWLLIHLRAACHCHLTKASAMFQRWVISSFFQSHAQMKGKPGSLSLGLTKWASMQSLL